MHHSTPYHSWIKGPALVLWALLLLWGRSGVAAQEVPDTPKLLRVTVDHADGGVLVQWEPSRDTAVDLYNVYKVEPRGALKLDVRSADVDTDTFSFKHFGSGLTDLEYGVTAEDTLDGTNSLESILGENQHKVVGTSLTFDPCEKEVRLDWTAYEGWGENISGYIVYGGPAGTSPDTLRIGSADVFSFTDPDVEFGQDYVYYVEAVHTSGLTSLSPLDSVGVHFPDGPAYLRIDWVSFSEDSHVELQFSVDSASQVSYYRILKKTDPASDFVELTTLDNTMQATYLVEDLYPSTDTNQYFMVQALHQPEDCFSPVVLGESNVGTSIDLESQFLDQVVYLHWTPYMDYATGLSGYIVQRRNGSGEFIDVASLGSGQTAWEERIETIVNGYQSGSVQYRVLALSNQVPGSDPGLSISRLTNVALETTLKVPSAFTPGSNDMNAEFKPILDFAPTDYIMVIYDRGGRKLFESSDPNQGWDGSYDGRSYVMEGVYIYHIQYRDHKGRFKTYTGNVAAIYP